MTWQSDALEREARLRTLNDVHEFPGPFTFKVIGDNTPEFVHVVHATVISIVGESVPPTISTRDSKGGRHQAVTLVVHIETAELVLDIYQALAKLTGVRFLL